MLHDALMPMKHAVGGRLLVLLLLVGLCRIVSAAEPGDRSTSAVLDLQREGYLAGSLLDAPAEADGPRKTFFWRSPAFAEPIEFALDGVVGFRFPRPAEARLPEAAGEWRVELADGGQLVGTIDAIDEQHVVAAVGSAEAPVRLRVRRNAVRSLYRGEAGAAYVGSSGLDGWLQSPSGTWRDEAGRLVSTVPGASLFRDLKAGPRARYDVTLSWRERPTLRLAVGGGEAGDSSSGYRLELRPEGVVAVREEDATKEGGVSRADLASCGDVPERGMTLTLFVDQQAGRLAVMLPDAQEAVADLTISPVVGKPRGGFSISVVAGSAALEALRVSPWRGGSLASDTSQTGAIRLRDGGSLSAVVEGMEPGSGQLAVRAAADATGGKPRRISIDTIDEIVFPSPAAATTAAVTRPPLQATDLCGSRLTGSLQRVEQGVVWLSHPGIEDLVPLPIAMVATLASTVRPDANQTLPGRIGRLACEQGSVWGCLVEGAGNGGNTHTAAIAWRPLGSLDASPLASATEGMPAQATIMYVEPPSADTAATGMAGAIGGIGGHIGAINGRPAVVALIAGSAAQRAGIQPGDVILAIAPRGDGRFVDSEGLSLEDAQHLLRGRVGSKLQLRLQRNGQDKPREVAMTRQRIAQLGRNPQLIQQALQVHDRLVPPEVHVDESLRNTFGSLLILRTGETLPCRVESIDERGVRVQLPESESVTVGADMVQAVELVPAAGRNVAAEKFRSLTTLPRSQRQHPPTHILRSLQGDYLRGRLVSMDEQTIRIAVEADPRDKPLAIPRGDVARLIWLHPETLDTPWEPPLSPAGQGLPVEGVTGIHDRLRMVATGIRGNVLMGTSPVVGPCRIDLEKIDRLLVGGARDESPVPLPYSQWKLQAAPEPRNLPPARP